MCELQMTPFKINNYNHMKLECRELIFLNEPTQNEKYMGMNVQKSNNF